MAEGGRGAGVRISGGPEGGIEEPLLFHDVSDDADAAVPVEEQQPSLAFPAEQEEEEEEEEEEGTPTPPSFSRLLRYARPEAFWISAGLLVLLLRLPFSLAMPHYISVALGCVLAHDAAGATRAIELFFISGALNAVLDFGNWFLFVAAQQRVVRRLRTELYASILREPPSAAPLRLGCC